MTDPIADLLTRIRNAHLAKHDRLDVPTSQLKVEICRILKEEGFIRNFRQLEAEPRGHAAHLPALQRRRARRRSATCSGSASRAGGSTAAPTRSGRC